MRRLEKLFWIALISLITMVVTVGLVKTRPAVLHEARAQAPYQSEFAR